MIMDSHQTFSGLTKHLSGLIKFDQINLPYIINGEAGQFLVLIISTDKAYNNYLKGEYY